MEYTTELSVIVEIENGKKGSSAIMSRLMAIQRELQQARINGHAVCAVVYEYEEPTQVDYFGYNATSSPPMSLPAYGVSRYFGFTVFVEGEYSLLIHQDRLFQVTPYARLQVCGTTAPVVKGSQELLPLPF